MKARRRIILPFVLIAALAIVLYLLRTQSGMGFESAQEFTKELQKRGYVMDEARNTNSKSMLDFEMPFVSLNTNKGHFTIYEFPSKEATDNAVINVSESGSRIKGKNMTTYVSWAGHPHFYTSGKLLVVYVGRDIDVLLDMREMMGQQEAGAKWYELPFSRNGQYQKSK